MNDAEACRKECAYFAFEPRPASTALTASIVVPVYNEEGGLGALIDEIVAAMNDFDIEIIAVDDGSTDATADVLRAVKVRHPELRVIRHEQNAGKSRAIRTGVLAARAPVIATLDGDGQNAPADIPPLIAQIERTGAGLVAGQRRDRQDRASRKLASRIANAVRQSLLKDGCADTACGLKVFRREAYLRLPFFDNMHRYLPALMRREGFPVEFATVSDRPRAYGQSKYTNLGRFLVGIVDLVGVSWLLARARKPASIAEERD